ncbi:hypothetical protein RR46_05612 [Papilio xuthus]|uniref:Uncharacterized protein n=1 Tax=Papilio xuthus TaxID=66420 RepID=A0A194Q0R1_PAPXU|nr:hypothetical protein RR46_05612 [Papilio xuthus]
MMKLKSVAGGQHVWMLAGKLPSCHIGNSERAARRPARYCRSVRPGHEAPLAAPRPPATCQPPKCETTRL